MEIDSLRKALTEIFPEVVASGGYFMKEDKNTLKYVSGNKVYLFNFIKRNDWKLEVLPLNKYKKESK